MAKYRPPKTDGLTRNLFETSQQWDLYIQYADQRLKHGLAERSLEWLARTSGIELDVIQAMHDEFNWTARVDQYDRFWEPEAPSTIEAQIQAAEATNFELGILAASILNTRLQAQPHLLTTSQLISIAKMLPQISRSQASISSEKIS